MKQELVYKINTRSQIWVRLENVVCKCETMSLEVRGLYLYTQLKQHIRLSIWGVEV